MLNTILEEDFDIIGVSECDIQDFDPQKPYSIEGFSTYFPLNREGSNKKRLLCFVKSSIEVKERKDLMSEAVSSVWLELSKGKHKTLICLVYRECSDLVSPGQMTQLSNL